MPSKKSIRKCKCGTPLTSYNSDRTCFHCQDKQSDQAIELENESREREKSRRSSMLLGFKPRPERRRRYCIHGHDTDISGRRPNGGCAECDRECKREARKGVAVTRT